MDMAYSLIKLLLTHQDQKLSRFTKLTCSNHQQGFFYHQPCVQIRSSDAECGYRVEIQYRQAIESQHMTASLDIL